MTCSHTCVDSFRSQQLEENCKACEVELPKEALNAIDAVHVRIRNPNLQD